MVEGACMRSAKRLGALVAAGLVAAPGLAVGRPGPAPDDQNLTKSRVSDASAAERPAAAEPKRRTIRGVVGGIERLDGVLRVAAGAETLTIRATPVQLADFSIGQGVELRVGEYDGILWLRPGGGGPETIGVSILAAPRRLRGEVQALDVSAGVLVVGGLPLNAHPGLLGRVTAGERVTLTYRDLGNRGWIDDIGPGEEVRTASKAAVLNPLLEEQPREVPLQLGGRSTATPVSGAAFDDEGPPPVTPPPAAAPPVPALPPSPDTLAPGANEAVSPNTAPEPTPGTTTPGTTAPGTTTPGAGGAETPVIEVD